MGRQQINCYLRYEGGKVSYVKDTGQLDSTFKPVLTRGMESELVLTFLTPEAEPAAIADFAAWEFVIDKDYNHDTPPVILVNEGITKNDNIITIPITPNTLELQTAFGDTPSLTDYAGELYAYDSDGKLALVIPLPLVINNIRYDGGDGPTENPDAYLDAAQIRALLNAGYELEFSADGESWHTEQADGDLYYHYRNRQIGGEWSDKIMIPKGEQGDPAPELKTQYSVDGSTLWHDEYAEDDAYMRTSSDNGGSWSGAIRILGQPGTAGSSSYTYVAYASDASGSGFSLTPSDTLKYRAEIHSETAIESPDADDFSGAVWVKYIGSDGTSGTSAGFGAPDATAETLTAGSEATAEVTASGEDTAKVFHFSFGIPKGADGTDGKSAYQLWLEQEGNEGKTLDDFFNAYRGADGTGLTVRGAYDAASTYQKTDTAMDAVQYNGSLWGYINATAGSGNAPPESAATVSNDYWTLLVAKGETGLDGRGIVSVEKTGTSGKVDTYTITYTDETTSTFTVTNGTNGQDGDDGLTPEIDPDTKHWMIGETDTNVKAEGTDGKTILNGTGAPSNGLGTDGDFYLDTNALNLYLKVSGAWTLKGSLAAGLQFAVSQADGDESTKTVSIRTVTVSADGSSVYSGSAQTVLYDFNIPTEEA